MRGGLEIYLVTMDSTTIRMWHPEKIVIEIWLGSVKEAPRKGFDIV